MSDPDLSRSSNKKQNDQINEKLWNDIEIDFRLEAFKFPDNKIYGIVKVIPESSRRFIEKFILVVNKRTKIDFHVSYDSIAASGFNTNTKDPSAYVKAIPNNKKWSQEPKLSDYFHFTGEVFALSPTISFTWPDKEENPKADLIVKWFHLGDKTAHKYIMYLDDIRQKQIEDVFYVSIQGFESGTSHTFQLVAKLLNGKETYRSDLMEFKVPERDSYKNQETEFITVTNELPPRNIPSIPLIENDKTSAENVNNKQQCRESSSVSREQTRKPSAVPKERSRKPSVTPKEQSPKPASLPEEPPKSDNKMYTCCNDSPHEKFPGIEHYLKNIGDTIPTSPKSLINGNKKSVPPKEKTNNDDDDVVMS
ncbi:unnamed protein product [Adineta steineri]|uniref:Uncharacterized protein n=1 Tax=Adineta steineri TaxID=433720 RepID=A0A819Q1D8_9BILA|nr:unnamed protein product [Adineta steineri]CAF4019574.1 unnamed protein product [Adineta steineri]